MDIIIASANVFRLELSAFVLVEAGYQIRECHTIHEVLGSIMQRPPEILLIDQTMFQGPDTGRMRVLIEQHAIAVVMLVTKAQVAPMLPEHADAYVTWPYQSADLLVHMRAFCTPINGVIAP